MDNDTGTKVDFSLKSVLNADLPSFMLSKERDKLFVFVLIILPSQFWTLELVMTYVNHADFFDNH